VFLEKFVRFQMGGFVNQRYSWVILGVGLASAPIGWGATVEYIGRGDLSTQGFGGDMFLPFVQGPAPVNAGPLVGFSASNLRLYDLYSGVGPGSNSTLSIGDAQAGTPLAVVPLSVQLSDIAYTNGQLYGIEANAGSIQIVSISDSGVIQPVATRSTTTTNMDWRLSGAVSGDSLFAMAIPAIGSSAPAYTINPQTAAVSTFTFSKAPSFAGATDSVINLAGDTVTVLGAFKQSAYSYPSGVFQQNLPVLSQYAPLISSDEFTYNYDPSKAAYASVGLSGAITFGHDGLSRFSAGFTATPWLLNGASPDGTTLSNLATAPGVQILTQVSGPATASVIETQQAPGPYSVRQLATDTISVPDVRGVYQFGITGNALTADYSYGTTVDHGRQVANSQFPIITVAVDPASSNLVGNGDFSLGAAGWESGSANTGSTPFYTNISSTGISSQGVELATDPFGYSAVRQFLELPTASTPMELSFTYSVNPAFGVTQDLQAYLGGELVGDVTAAGSPQTFQTIITDPSLQNLSNAELRFQAAGGNTIVYIDNISLTAVPEPASIGTLGVACGSLFLRRRSRFAPRYTALNGA
jgi:hypothetical protein